MANSSPKSKLLSFPVLKQAKNLIYRAFPNFIPPSKEYSDWYNFIDTSQWWNETQLKEYQWKKLKEVLDYSFQNIPYYQGIFKKMGASPEDIRTPADFEKIPLLTREILGNQAEELLPIGIDMKKMTKVASSGSTGDPVSIYKTSRDFLIEEAFMYNQWARVGYKAKDSRVIIRGATLPGNKMWDFTPSNNVWIFSSFHLSSDNIGLMVDKLNKIRPKFLHVYPSSLWVFTNLVIENNLKIGFVPQAILCGSEKLFDHQRKLFTEVYGCRCFTWLGLTEQTVLAGECEHSTELHIFPQHSYTELVDSSGQVITKPGISGRLVGTNLHRNTFPLIRYVSGDLTQYSDGPCKCGRQFRRIKEVDGREMYMIVSLDDRLIPAMAIIFLQKILDYSKVQQIQLYQKEKGIVEIRLIKGANFSEKDASDALALCDHLGKITNDTISFTVSYHQTLVRTASGKDKFLIQELPVKFYN